ncbi:MAG: hypothetical protein COT84_07660 [Chlamydiae bacterium CG10_big_fil_rev_8_21_14_0_10_35_9]|nr:MAG: hypothetical protein COT84_07660 [Chlamydiae bacterium CG10_big_fil_rev_8_21_14_0_10_35_9]
MCFVYLIRTHIIHTISLADYRAVFSFFSMDSLDETIFENPLGKSLIFKGNFLILQTKIFLFSDFF